MGPATGSVDEYVPLYRDGQFVGDQTMTREQLAAVIGRLLQDIEAGRIFVESATTETLRTLVSQYHDEVVMMTKQLDLLTASLVERKKREAVLDEQIVQVREESNELRQWLDETVQVVTSQLRDNELDQGSLVDVTNQLRQVIDKIQEYEARISDIERASYDDQSQIRALQVDMERVKLVDLVALQNRQDSLRKDLTGSLDGLVQRVEALEKTKATESEALLEQARRIDELEKAIADLADKYERDVSNLNNRLLFQQAQISALETKIMNIQATMLGLSGGADELKKEADIIKALLAVTAMFGLR